MNELIAGIVGVIISAPIFYSIGKRVAVRRVTEDIYKTIMEAFSGVEETDSKGP